MGRPARPRSKIRVPGAGRGPHRIVRFRPERCPAGRVGEADRGDSAMKARLIAASALIAAFTMPALAQEEFYIVHDSSTKKCSVVQQKPTGGTLTIAGSGSV